jgi:DNA-binding GntR family transcriptional regulator
MIRTRNGARPRNNDAHIPDSSITARPIVVAREPIHEQILPHIRDDIIDGRWPPGERLPEPLLCKEFGISRTPLRAALKLLEADGFVELLPHVGAVVTAPGPLEVAERMEVLAALEEKAAAKVAHARPAAALATIKRLHTAMTKAAGKGDAAIYYRLNDEFHRAIVLGAENRTLADLHEHVMWHVHRARSRANAYERVERDAAAHHDRIVEEILAGDATAAAAALRDHLGEVGQLMLGPTR